MLLMGLRSREDPLDDSLGSWGLRSLRRKVMGLRYGRLTVSITMLAKVYKKDDVLCSSV